MNKDLFHTLDVKMKERSSPKVDVESYRSCQGISEAIQVYDNPQIRNWTVNRPQNLNQELGPLKSRSSESPNSSEAIHAYGGDSKNHKISRDPKDNHQS